MSWVDGPGAGRQFGGCDGVVRHFRHGVRDGLADGVQSGQRTVHLHQAAHLQRAKVDGGDPEALDDRAEQFFGVLVVAGVEQDPATGVGDPEFFKVDESSGC